jgi:hypothetical protein
MAQNTQQGGRDQGGNQTSTSNRGFASMDDDKQRSIASEGGRAAHAQGTAHEFTSEEAREAGRKGGQSGTSGDSDSDRDMQASGDNRSQQTQGRERDEDGQFTSSDRGGSSSERSSRSDDDRGGRTGGRNE